MTSARTDVALIFGSTREEHLCDDVAMWAAEQAWSQRHFSLDVVGPAEFASPMPRRHGDSAEVTALRQRLRKADAFVLVTPEYDHGHVAALIRLMDATAAEWQAKPVGLVAYGGSSGGLRAVEQLRLLCAERHAVTVPAAVNFTDVRRQFDASGHLRQPHGPTVAMAAMLEQLQWWAVALHAARQKQPYALVGDRRGAYSPASFKSGATSIGSAGSAAHSCSEAV